MNSEDYYRKYLKYKKKYLDLLGGKKSRSHHHRHHRHMINPIDLSFRQPIPLIPIQPVPLPVPLPIRLSVPLQSNVSSENNLNNLLSKLLINNKTNEQYDEFNSAFNYNTKTFNKNVFIKIFNTIYQITTKTYKGNTKQTIVNEKNSVIFQLRSINNWSDNSVNSFESLLNILSYKITLNNFEIQKYQKLIKDYIILSELESLMV